MLRECAKIWVVHTFESDAEANARLAVLDHCSRGLFALAVRMFDASTLKPSFFHAAIGLATMARECWSQYKLNVGAFTTQVGEHFVKLTKRALARHTNHQARDSLVQCLQRNDVDVFEVMRLWPRDLAKHRKRPEQSREFAREGECPTCQAPRGDLGLECPSCASSATVVAWATSGNFPLAVSVAMRDEQRNSDRFREARVELRATLKRLRELGSREYARARATEAELASVRAENVKLLSQITRRPANKQQGKKKVRKT